MTQPPVQPVSVAQRDNPRVICGECGHQLATGFPQSQRCPFCGGTRRDYKVGLTATLSSSGALTVVRRYVVKRLGWLAAGCALIAAGAVPGLLIGGTAGVLVGVVLGVAGLLFLPPWRVPVNERTKA